jgi:hypothetical protein
VNRAELELAIATVVEIIGQDHVLVVGSQSILGSYDESQLRRGRLRHTRSTSHLFAMMSVNHSPLGSTRPRGSGRHSMINMGSTSRE